MLLSISLVSTCIIVNRFTIFSVNFLSMISASFLIDTIDIYSDTLIFLKTINQHQLVDNSISNAIEGTEKYHLAEYIIISCYLNDI